MVTVDDEGTIILVNYSIDSENGYLILGKDECGSNFWIKNYKYAEEREMK